MSNCNKLSFFLIALFISSIAHAKLHEFETTHLKTEGGGGVGSLLVEDSAFLNPASIAFFNTSSIYFQKDSEKTTDQINTSYPKANSYGFVLAQADAALSGTISYVNQRESTFSRKRWGLTVASPLSQVSSFGISLRSSRDDDSANNTSKKYYQTVFGVTHAISESTSVGVVALDPFKSKADETKIVIGLQQNLLEYISGVFDVGADYTKDQLSKTLIVRGGIQVKLLDDFFIRVGGFNDKLRNEKGEGYGIAWIQPKLSFEFGLKSTRATISSNEITNKETSFSISLRGF